MVTKSKKPKKSQKRKKLKKPKTEKWRRQIDIMAIPGVREALQRVADAVREDDRRERYRRAQGLARLRDLPLN